MIAGSVASGFSDRFHKSRLVSEISKYHCYLGYLQSQEDKLFELNFWKIFKWTKVVPAKEADLVWERPDIDAYELTLEDEPATGFWRDILKMVGWHRVFGKKKTEV
jgi:hypothetical protein